jgi:hypothetical protein
MCLSSIFVKSTAKRINENEGRGGDRQPGPVLRNLFGDIEVHIKSAFWKMFSKTRMGADEYTFAFFGMAE